MPDFKSKINAMKEAKIKASQQQNEESIQENFDRTFSNQESTESNQESLKFDTRVLEDVNSGLSPEQIASRKQIADQSYGGREDLVQMNPTKGGTEVLSNEKNEIFNQNNVIIFSLVLIILFLLFRRK